MPPASEVQNYLAGAWRMMCGRTDGLELLDLSADGFWNSFFAILYAAPPMFLGWVVFERVNVLPGVEFFADRVSVIASLALVDLAGWLLPLLGLALVARPAGIAHRFVPYVVASNWGTVILSWLMLPVTLLRVVLPEAGSLTEFLAFVLFVAIIVLDWRLTNVAIARGPAVASMVYVGMLAASFAVLLVLQGLFGLVPLP